MEGVAIKVEEFRALDNGVGSSQSCRGEGGGESTQMMSIGGDDDQETQLPNRENDATSVATTTAAWNSQKYGDAGRLSFSTAANES